MTPRANGAPGKVGPDGRTGGNINLYAAQITFSETVKPGNVILTSTGGIGGTGQWGHSGIPGPGLNAPPPKRTDDRRNRATGGKGGDGGKGGKGGKITINSIDSFPNGNFKINISGGAGGKGGGSGHGEANGVWDGRLWMHGTEGYLGQQGPSGPKGAQSIISGKPGFIKMDGPDRLHLDSYRLSNMGLILHI